MYHRFNARITAAALAGSLLAAPAAWSQETAPTPLAPLEKHQPARQLETLTPAEIETQQKLAIESYEAGDHLKFVQATMRLRNARPYEPRYMVGMVVGGALLGRPKTAYSYMHKMQQQGLTYDFNQTEDTQSLRATEVYDYLNKLLIKAGEPTGIGKTAVELPKTSHYPEALEWDASAGRFLVGTLEKGKILSVGLDGKVSDFIVADKTNGLRAVYGLAVDAPRKRLWVSSAATPAYGKLADGELGRTALLEFDLASGEFLNRFEPPADELPHLLGSIGVTPSGDVYVMDRAIPLLLVKAAASDSLEFFMASKQFTGFRDLALSGSGKQLYVADAAMGILVIDIEKNVVGLLGAPDTLNLGGISGIDFVNGSLYVVQNGIQPQRLQRLDLDPGGTGVLNVLLLASGLESYNSPSFGRVHGEDVYYFAGSNVPGENAGKIKPLLLRTPVEPEEGRLTTEQRLIQETTLEGKRQ